MYKKFFLLSCIFICTLRLTGNDIFVSYHLRWQKPIIEKISDDIQHAYFYFEGAGLHYSNGFLTSEFVARFPLTDGNIVPIVSIENSTWQPLTTEELKLVDAALANQAIEINTQIFYTQKKPELHIRFFPFRKNGATFEKLISFDLKVVQKSVFASKVQKAKTYATKSILASGNFYKLAINKTGIHKITFDDFKTLGIHTAQLPTHRIALFGNGGHMLAENTSDFVYDDLQEIPIQVIDLNNNGVFEEEDYVLFYAVGIIAWKPSSDYYSHTLNIYADYAYYFINVDEHIGLKKRIQQKAESSQSKTHEVSTYDFYDLYEKDQLCPNDEGRIWFSDAYDAITSYDYAMHLPDIQDGEKAMLRFSVASRSSAYSQFTFTINSAQQFQLTLPPHKDGVIQLGTYSFIPNSNAININVNYQKPTNNSVGWLDYIEMFARCKLQFANTSQLSFRNKSVVGDANIVEYVFNTQGNLTTVWDVSDPTNVVKVEGRLNANIFRFKIEANVLREFVAFYGSSFYSVIPIGKIQNQNLHGINTADFVIITHPDFIQSAQELADFRASNDGFSTAVVTTTQIYNEFSSGSQDIAAIRNFLKMLYDRSNATSPQNVLLFGKASVDFRDRTGTASNFIPNYQGSCPFDKNKCLSTDDFFVKLDDGEGMNNMGTMDAGIGRFPVRTKTQAQIVVQKTKNYSSQKLLSTTTSNSVSNFADWRNVVTFCADDDADQYHFYDAEGQANFIADNYPVINIDKIYLDAFKKVSTSQGQRYPDATLALSQRIMKGSLMLTYMGHGGDNGWAHERFLKRSDISAWKNKYNLPLFFAGSCSFGIYDKKNNQSPSEDILFKSDGGGIAVISATRVSYSSTNKQFGIKLHQLAFEKDNNAYRTIGQFYAQAKNVSSSVDMYVLFGDPSLTLAYPKYNVSTDSINGKSLANSQDTIKALQFISIKGRVTDESLQTVSSFNGYVYPTVFDKASTVVTLLNNPNSIQKTFALQKNILYKGKVSVKNGHFEFSFLVPKDINYEYGFGKISYYAFADNKDANGFDSLLVGGINDTLINDNAGPEIKLYLNDENFVSGGITTSNPILYALIKDENGVNTVGTGIGHDIIAFIDDEVDKSIVLNDFFEYNENSYTSGKINYLLSNINLGQHTLTLRAWDVLNNMNQTTISFTVVNDEALQLDHVLNYPNPFTTQTSFYFEHNHPGLSMDISIQIFTISGKLVKTIRYTEASNSLRVGPISWNGKDDFGDALAKGVYLYKLRVKTTDNKIAEKIEKLVIL